MGAVQVLSRAMQPGMHGDLGGQSVYIATTWGKQLIVG